MAKGGNFEGEIAKDLSLYLTLGETEEYCWKTEGSGSRATSRSKNKKHMIRTDMFGDITYSHPDCKWWFDIFSMECKTGYAKKTKSKKTNRERFTHWSLLDLIDSQQSATQFHIFWNECLHDSIESDREPLLIFRRNHRSACIAMHEDIFDGFCKRFDYPEDFNIISIDGEFCYLPIKIMNLRQFFAWTENISPSVIQNYIVRKLMQRR